MKNKPVVFGVVFILLVMAFTTINVVAKEKPENVKLEMKEDISEDTELNIKELNIPDFLEGILAFIVGAIGGLLLLILGYYFPPSNQ